MSYKKTCKDMLRRNFKTIYPLQNHHGPHSDSTVVHTLCRWAVTSRRSGEHRWVNIYLPCVTYWYKSFHSHRAFVVAKLLERRQSDLTPPPSGGEDEEDYYGPPVFQDQLFRYVIYIIHALWFYFTRPYSNYESKYQRHFDYGPPVFQY